MILRAFRAALVAVFACIACACPAHAQDSKVIRLVVPVPAGGSVDTTARMVAQRLQTRGINVIVDNRPGGNTLIGADLVAHASPDGGTFLYTSTPLAIAPLLTPTSFKADSLVPVIQVSTETFGLVVRTESPLASVQDVVRAAAGRAQGIDCIAVPGAPEVACEELKARLDGRSTTVPYPGLAPANVALLGGHGDVMFSPMPSLVPLLKGGQVRLIAASSQAGLPEGSGAVPLLADVWKGFVLEGFTGIFAPKGTPEDKVRQLNRDIDAILHEPEMRALMQANGQAVVGGDPRVLGSQMRAAQARYEEIVTRLKLGVQKR